jgi:hypothetical protein
MNKEHNLRLSRILVGIILLGLISAPIIVPNTISAAGTIPYPTSIDNAKVTETDISNMGSKGLIVGNGELNGIVYSSGNDLYIRVSKNDVWDGRVNTSGDPALPVIKPATHSWTGTNGAQASWNNYTNPCPVPCADIKLAAVTGQSGWNATLDLKLAKATVTTSVDTSTVRALAQSNVFYINSSRTMTLQGVAQSFLPAATTGTTNGVQWLRQNLPADSDTTGMDVYLAMGSSGTRQVVAVVTTLDTSDPLTAAINLVNSTLGQTDTVLVQTHETTWQDFWALSGVQLSEAKFERMWYREVYFFRCYAKSGATGVGLRAAMYTTPGWHGTFKFNYNEQQGYAAAGPINHPELVEPLINVINNYWPRAKWLAQTCFVNCEGGFVHSDVYNPHEPDPANCTSKNKHQSAYLPWGFSLGMQGHIATNLWEYYQYKPDTTYLNNKIYPILKDMALFYCSFLEKCSLDGNSKFIIGPSFFPEDGSYGQDNTSYDNAYITYGLNAAKKAATILNVDSSLVTRINTALSKMPYYGTVADPNQGNQTIVEPWKGKGVPTADRHASNIQAVYPAGVVNWFSSQSEKDLFKRTAIKGATIDETNAYITMNVVRARLGMVTEAYNDALISPRPGYQYYVEQPNGLFWLNEGHEYYISEQTAYARLICELLMQSVGDIIRVFPAWPTNKDAQFSGLRAQGGFLVSARMTTGIVNNVQITSTVGGNLSLVNPWPGLTITVTDQGTGGNVSYTSAGETITFATQAGKTYLIATTTTPTPGPSATPTPTPTSIPGGTNAVLNKTATSNAYWGTESPDKAVDGLVTNNSKWCTDVNPGAQWLQVDIGQVCTMNRWVVKHAAAGGESATLNTKDFKLQKSSDGSTWVDVDAVTGNTANITDRNVTSFTSRYVRLYVTVPTQTTDLHSRIYELELYTVSGSATATPTPTPTPTPGSTATPTPIPTPGIGPIAYWNFNEGSGTTAADGSGNGHIGTLTGSAGWTTSGKTGGALSLNGSGYVNIATPDTIVLGNANCTVAAWVKTSSTSAMGILIKDNNGVHLSGDKLLGVNHASTKFGIDHGWVTNLDSNKNITDGAWHHVAWTQQKDGSGSSEVWKLYVDGVYEVTKNAVTKDDNAGNTIHIGGGSSSSYFPNNFNGSIDEVRIYNRVLSDAEIAILE